MFGLGEFFSLACAFCWAVAVVLFRRAGETMRPFELNLFKNCLTLLLLVPTLIVTAWWSGQALSWPQMSTWDWSVTILSGLIGLAVGDTLYFQALNRIGASRTAIAGTLFSPFVIVLAAVFLAERLSVGQMGGVGLVLAGLILVNRPRRGLTEVFDRGGFGLAVGAIFCMAAGVVMVKPILETEPFLWIVTLRIAAGLLGMICVVAARHRWRTMWRHLREVHHWPTILTGSFFGAYLSMLLWLAGYKYTDASIASVLNETAAIWILILAAIFLNERLRQHQLAGAGLAVAGVTIVTLL